MKLAIREFPPTSSTKTNGAQSVVCPFVLYNNGHSSPSPIWLTPIKLDAAISGNPEDYGKLIRMAVWGKPISKHQTLADYCSLDVFHLNGSTDTYRAGMVGLREMLIAGSFNDEEQTGEAFLIRVSHAGWGHDLVGVWADSRQSAKQFCREVIKEIKLEEHFEREGFSKSDLYDFENA